MQTFSSLKSSFFHPVLRRATILRHCQHPTKEISPSILYTKTHFFDGGLKTIPWARRALPLTLLPLRRDLCVRDCLVCGHRKYSKKRIWNYASTLTRIDNPELRREPVLDSVSSSFLDSGSAVGVPAVPVVSAVLESKPEPLMPPNCRICGDGGRLPWPAKLPRRPFSSRPWEHDAVAAAKAAAAA